MYSDYLKTLSNSGQSIQNLKDEQMNKVGNLFDQQYEGLQKNIGNLTSDIAGFDLDNVVSKAIDTTTTVLGQSLESASLFMNLRKKLKGIPEGEEGEEADPLTSLLSGFKSKLSSVVGDGKNTLSDLTTGAMDKATSFAKSQLSKVTDGIDNVTDQVTGQIDNITDQVNNQVNNAVNTANNAVNKATSIANDAEQQLGGVLNRASNIADNLPGSVSDVTETLSGQPESVITGAKNVVMNYLNTPVVKSTDLQAKTIDIPNTELGGGKLTTTEPSGTGEGNVEMKTISQSGGLEDETEELSSAMGTAETRLNSAKSLLDTFTNGMSKAGSIAGDVAGDIAEGAEDVGITALEGAGLSLESIPIVGNVIGSLMAIGGTIWGAVSGANQSNKTDDANKEIGQDQVEQAQTKINELKTQLTDDNSQFTGSNVLSSMNSKLSQMGSNIF